MGQDPAEHTHIRNSYRSAHHTDHGRPTRRAPDRPWGRRLARSPATVDRRREFPPTSTTIDPHNLAEADAKWHEDGSGEGHTSSRAATPSPCRGPYPYACRQRQHHKPKFKTRPGGRAKSHSGSNLRLEDHHKMGAKNGPANGGEPRPCVTAHASVAPRAEGVRHGSLSRKSDCGAHAIFFNCTYNSTTGNALWLLWRRKV